MEHKLSVCALVGKQFPAIRALCKERQSSGSKRNVFHFFLLFLDFVKINLLLAICMLQGLRWSSMFFSSFLAHLLLNFLFPWLVTVWGFFLLTATGNEVGGSWKIVALPTGLCQQTLALDIFSALILVLVSSCPERNKSLKNTYFDYTG